uniref:S-adenosylmethionine-dependent methyltransferase domain-containing protein n=1 Tax=Chromera velia CCMP2878 TaxID=1169474 RepID=A0A0G4FFS7_9ALVE|eukprot:Cvel_16756.t1-p1 / transcript=Cvel_16756.t1 / gene=Cvel_16756 / organism=Chromera_velia_CCMP2878 / gene_product=Ribosomal RNA large subunit methyltransferase I, putative / transcript_product=Ribosomal RNA large subunit methyltransferase I, putative / location=Cvel_scaffold1306:30964-34649(-) / protein_length=614 / sequence_SO=supercontig / SO=protein_coding / is_pseudo=false
MIFLPPSHKNQNFVWFLLASVLSLCHTPYTSAFHCRSPSSRHFPSRRLSPSPLGVVFPAGPSLAASTKDAFGLTAETVSETAYTRKTKRESKSVEGTGQGQKQKARRSLIRSNVLQKRPVVLRLVPQSSAKESLRKGDPWVFSDAIKRKINGPPGCLALLQDEAGKPLALGLYDSSSPLAFRMLSLYNSPQRRNRLLNRRQRQEETEEWHKSEPNEVSSSLIASRLERALDLRERLFGVSSHLMLRPPSLSPSPSRSLEEVSSEREREGVSVTTGYRLVNGEGDGLPGLVIDRYGPYAVVRLDGAGPAGFYDGGGIGQFLVDRLHGLDAVFLKGGVTEGAGREEGEGASRKSVSLLASSSSCPSKDVEVLLKHPIEFYENGMVMHSDPLRGQKTGAFLDQRENRQIIRKIAAGGKRVLNLFAYNGGFSVAAGQGGASHVTSVDSSKGAIEASRAVWERNGLSPGRHLPVVGDALEFLKSSTEFNERVEAMLQKEDLGGVPGGGDVKVKKKEWEVVVVDPPSFACSRASLMGAEKKYKELFEMAARVTASGGCLALSSCSSHLRLERFMEICESAVSSAGRTGKVIEVRQQAGDHPFPLSSFAMRYLKFVLIELD